MKKDLTQIKEQFLAEVEKVKSLPELEELENKYLGRKSGALTAIMKNLKTLSKDQIKEVGQLANQVKNEIGEKISLTKDRLSHQTDDGFFDYTLPDLDGTTIVRQIRREEISFPFVMMSGEESVAERCVAAEGAVAFLQKPLDMSVIRKILQDCLGFF